MSHSHQTIQYQDRRNLSFSSIAIILIFFLVTSQIFILPLPEIATQVFRPLMIAMILIHMMRNGYIRSAPRTLAFLVAIHAVLALLYHAELWTHDNIMDGAAVALFFAMFAFAVGAAWTRKELKYIIAASFLGCFVCAVALLISNDPTDLNAATAGHLDLAGYSVNRNKNAYQYAFGTILGLIYLLYGKNNKKAIVFLMTIVIAYALVYSQCRGAFFSAVGGFSVMLIGKLLEIRKRKGTGTAVVWTLVMIAAYIGVYYLLKNSELNRLIDAESTSGRDESMEAAWQLFLNSNLFGKLFGNGFGYESQQTQEIGAHIIYLGYLVSMGLIGSGLTALMFLASFRRVFGPAAYALVTTAFMKTLFEGADYNVFIPLIIGITICHYTRMTGRNYHELFGK